MSILPVSVSLAIRIVCIGTLGIGATAFGPVHRVFAVPADAGFVSVGVIHQSVLFLFRLTRAHFLDRIGVALVDIDLPKTNRTHRKGKTEDTTRQRFHCQITNETCKHNTRTANLLPGC